MSITVHGSVFRGPRRDGDFGWMIEQDDYADALFVFNDNEEQFLAFVKDPGGDRGCSAGGGNAVIRPWRCADPPRAAGVPTGTLQAGGYPALTPETRAVIDDALGRIGALVATGRYRRLFYSASPHGGLGTGIFAVGDDVREYIVSGLKGLGASDAAEPHRAP